MNRLTLPNLRITRLVYPAYDLAGRRGWLAVIRDRRRKGWFAYRVVVL